MDPKQTDQTVRGAVPLPKGTGKKVVVTVIADDEALKQQAVDAGADFVGFDDIIAKIKGGWVDFDVLIATPSAMSQVRPLGRQLGPKGLMPNPKTGTCGKLSFSAEDLAENCTAIIKAIIKAKPASAKGVYIQSCTLSATMTPGIKVETRDIAKEMAQ